MLSCCSMLIFYYTFFLVLFNLMYVLLLFFFFQAEDGIRDIGVTGVQTCALPIFSALDRDLVRERRDLGELLVPHLLEQRDRLQPAGVHRSAPPGSRSGRPYPNRDRKSVV